MATIEDLEKMSPNAMDEVLEAIHFKAFNLLVQDMKKFLTNNEDSFAKELLLSGPQAFYEVVAKELLQENRIMLLRDYFEDWKDNDSSDYSDRFIELLRIGLCHLESGGNIQFQKFSYLHLESTWKSKLRTLSPGNFKMVPKVNLHKGKKLFCLLKSYSLQATHSAISL